MGQVTISYDEYEGNQGRALIRMPEKQAGQRECMCVY